MVNTKHASCMGQAQSHWSQVFRSQSPGPCHQLLEACNSGLFKILLKIVSLYFGATRLDHLDEPLRMCLRPAWHDEFAEVVNLESSEAFECYGGEINQTKGHRGREHVQELRDADAPVETNLINIEATTVVIIQLIEKLVDHCIRISR